MNVKIGPIEVEVEIVDEIKGEDGANLCGQIDSIEGWIKLASYTSPSARNAIFWHEVVHEILNQAGLGGEEITVRKEQIVNVIGYGIAGILKYNPGLLEAEL